MSLRVWSMAAPFALLAHGCVVPGPNEQDGSRVSGGQETAESTWVGRIEQGGFVCSASLIDDRIVLTAKHCLDEGIDPASVLFYAGTGIAADTLVARAIALHYVGPVQGARGLPPDDVAVIALDRPVTLVSPYPSISSSGIARLQGQTVEVIGFAADGEGGASGIRRSGTARISDVFGGYGSAFLLDRHLTSNGDSGGPALLASTGRIIGVVSGGGEGSTMIARVDTRDDLVAAARRDVARTPASSEPLGPDSENGDGAQPDPAEPGTEDDCGVTYCVADDGFCDIGMACCAEDPDCDEVPPAACACDQTTGCDADEGGGADCACDRDCEDVESAACACDATFECDPDDGGGDCACDADCPADPPSACGCDVTYDCDPNDAGEDCACDVDCDADCACDLTYDCDVGDDGWDCACDVDCDADCACDLTYDCDVDDDGWDCACDVDC